jgi:hypothetical protein
MNLLSIHQGYSPNVIHGFGDGGRSGYGDGDGCGFGAGFGTGPSAGSGTALGLALGGGSGKKAFGCVLVVQEACTALSGLAFDSTGLSLSLSLSLRCTSYARSLKSLSASFLSTKLSKPTQSSL